MLVFWQLTVPNTKIGEVENKIPNANDLIRNTDYGGKTKDIEGKYFTNADYHKFTSNTFDAKIETKTISGQI